MTDLDIIKQIKKELYINKLDWHLYSLGGNGLVYSLNLSNCGINTLDSIISKLKSLKNLTYLDLKDNQISDISPLKKLKNLRDLDLRKNQISDISPLKELTKLTRLYLDDNQISDISPLRELTKLIWLWLDRNQVRDISPLDKLTNLEDVHLRENPFEELPLWVFESKLDLHRGYWYDYTTDDFIQAFGICIGDNPLKSPPPEIVKQGKEAIKNYFKSLESKKTVKLNEVKILLVGEGMSGKTSLLKQFQGLPFDKDESQTHGINVVSLPAKKIKGFIDTNGLKDYRIHFWDFGGQEIMHASHQFFLSQRSLYILVLDSRTDSKKYHWLKHIEKFGGDSPLIVVMNKIDANPNYNIEQKRINESFPHIKNRFHRISCQTQEGLPELVKCLAKAIPETSLFGTEISIDWMNVKEKLVEETKANRYISRERFVEICQDNNVTDQSSQQTLLQYLNDLGVVLYFKQLNLANIYVLDPHWVTIGVYKIINSEQTKDGILKEGDLEYILNKEEIKKHEYDPAREKKIFYSPEEQRYILSIMIQFELCYEYDKRKNHYIIPDLLPKELKDEPELNQGILLRFVMTYDYLPAPIISRLMLRLKNDIVDGQQWKYGMILDNKEFGCQAKIKEDEPNKRIDITVQGEFLCKRQYFSAIRHNIHDINKDFENLEVQEFIPLPGYPDILVEFQELLGYEKEGIEKYFSGKLRKYFSVSDMLDSVITKEERSKKMDDRINIHISNVGNPQQNVTQHVEQTVTQQQTIAQEVRNVKVLFKNLKEDILDEVEIEIEDENEKQRIKNELDRADAAFSQLEKAASEGKKELPASTKSRIGEFIDKLSDENSRINKALRLVSKGAEKVQQLGRFYNKVAPYFALPSIPPILLGKEESEKK